LPAAVVLDTSVILKWLRQGEVLAKESLALRDVYLQGNLTLLSPTLLIYELANVLRYKSELSSEQVQEAVESLLDFGFEWLSPSPETMSPAVRIAYQYGITVYDAAFVAIAEVLGIKFVTADKKLVERLHGLPYVYYLGEFNPGWLFT
jgi:predicted nucleic acid-binding protein